MPSRPLHTSRLARLASFLLLVVALVAGSLTAASAGPPLTAPTALSPDGVSQAGIPVLEWDRVPGATSYTVEVSRSPGFESTQWSVSTVNRRAVPTKQLRAGTTYWRVRAVSKAGGSDWAEASFDRDELAGPSLLSPASGSLLNQPEEPALVSWTPVDGAKSYSLEVSTDSAFTDDNLIDTYSVTTTTALIPNPAVAQPYYWRVRALLDTDIVTSWSEVWEYQIGGLSKPELVAPADDESFTDVVDVVLDWEPVLGAKSYNLQVSTDENFSPTLLDVNVQNVTGTRFSPPTTLANDQYYWRVQPVDALGNKLDWSAVDVWRFRRHWPDQPTLEYPVDGDVVGDPFHYQWTPARQASSYLLQMSMDSSFQSGVRECETTQTTYTPVEGTSNDCWPTALGTYYWRVVAIDAPGLTRDRKDITTDWISAEVGSFTYDPDVPVLQAPAPAATVEIPTLRWAPVAGAVKYRVTVTTVSDGAGAGTFTTTGTSFTPRTRLTPGKTYRWQVQAVSRSNRIGSGLLETSRRTFTVAEPSDTPGSTPEPSGPPAPSSRFPTLSWSSVTDATHYQILARPSGTIAWTRLTDKFSYPVGEDDEGKFLAPGTYQWRVEAYQGSVLLSESSTTSTFAVTDYAPIIGAKAAMTGEALRNPATSCATALPGRCHDLRHTPVLSWEPHPEVGFYKVWLARDEQMTNVLSTYPRTVEGTEFIPTASLPDSQAGSAYYWMVQACKFDGFCSPATHATRAFNKLSKPVQLLTPEVDASQSHDITFTWRDYLDTNQDDSASPVANPSGVHTVAPRVEANRYRIQVAANANFQAPLLDEVLVDQTTFTSYNNTYPEGPLYWRVQAVDGSNNNLTWSSSARFFKSSPQVTPLSPRNNVEVPGSFAFRWEPLEFAALYEVEVYKDGDTTGSKANKVTSAKIAQVGFSWIKPMAVASTPYTWRVRPLDVKNRPGPWTDLADPAARFRVVGTAPEAVAPDDGTQLVTNDALFSWSAVPGATSYKFERRKVGTTASAETVTTPALAWAPKAAIADGEWQWRVSSLDTDGKVMGSSLWRSFQVDGAAPTIVSYRPTKPAKRGANVVITFSEPVVGVSKATIRIFPHGKKKALAATVKPAASGLTATLNPTALLKKKSKYTVKVRPGIQDAVGNQLPAKTWTFTTK